MASIDSAKRFLVVDDLATMRRLMRNLLKEIGHSQVEEAETGALALTALRASQFDFVLSEWTLPDMDGLALLREMRADPALAAIPVLMVTSEARRENVVAAAEAGVKGYIVKPFTKAVLEKKLATIMTKGPAGG